MIRFAVIALILFGTSASATVEHYAYQARIEGMVCAFCAYNVSKTIGSLPAVVADSVNVDLESKLVRFRATERIDRADIAGAIKDLGFVLATLDVIDSLDTEPISIQDSPLMVVDLDAEDVERFEAILEAIGNIASSHRLYVVIKAPLALEKEVLTPILMGKKRAIHVRYVATDHDAISVNLFTPPAGTSE